MQVFLLRLLTVQTISSNVVIFLSQTTKMPKLLQKLHNNQKISQKQSNLNKKNQQVIERHISPTLINHNPKMQEMTGIIKIVCNKKVDHSLMKLFKIEIGNFWLKVRKPIQRKPRLIRLRVKHLCKQDFYKNLINLLTNSRMKKCLILVKPDQLIQNTLLLWLIQSFKTSLLKMERME